MNYLAMDEKIKFKGASLRYFANGEKHIDRFCTINVLLLVFKGTLRFSENGKEFEVSEGEYFIQRKNCEQKGNIKSDMPEYLYAHFDGEWREAGENALEKKGRFDINKLMPLMIKLDKLSHRNAPYIEKITCFYEILAALSKKEEDKEISDEIKEYIDCNFREKLTLESLSNEFHLCKNQIINLFKKKFSLTPFEYVNLLKLSEAEYFLEVDHTPIEEIAYKAGFNDYSQFYRLFVRKHGISPKQWRKLRKQRM